MPGAGIEPDARSATASDDASVRLPRLVESTRVLEGLSVLDWLLLWTLRQERTEYSGGQSHRHLEVRDGHFCALQRF